MTIEDLKKYDEIRENENKNRFEFFKIAEKRTEELKNEMTKKDKHITELKNIINYYIFDIEKIATKDEMEYITKILTK